MSLSQPLILDAALALLDEFGLADLSMRRLAGTLGVQPGALYNHVPNKQALLAAVADRILDDVTEPLGPWRSSVDAWARSLRAALLAHRDSADLVATARGFRLSQRDVTRHPTVILAASGMAHDSARAASATILHFTLGHVAEEQASADWQRFGPGSLDDTPASDDSFALGLGLVLDGIQAQLAR